MISTYSGLTSFTIPIHGSVFSVVQISTSRSTSSASFFSIPDLPVPRGLERRLVVGPEGLLGAPDVQMIPRQDLRAADLAPGVEVGVNADLLEHLQPPVVAEELRPLVVARALPTGLDERRAQPPVAAGKDAFNVALAGIVRLQVHARPPRHRCEPPLDLLDVRHLPL